METEEDNAWVIAKLDDEIESLKTKIAMATEDLADARLILGQTMSSVTIKGDSVETRELVRSSMNSLKILQHRLEY